MPASQVRVDAQDNVWTVDEMNNSVIKGDPQGTHIDSAGEIFKLKLDGTVVGLQLG